MCLEKFQCVSRNPPKLTISMGGIVLIQVEQFTYLDGVISQDARCELNIKRKINLATSVASSLNAICKSKDISAHGLRSECTVHWSCLSCCTTQRRGP